LTKKQENILNKAMAGAIDERDRVPKKKKGA
jgi:hypothetical protein